LHKAIKQKAFVVYNWSYRRFDENIEKVEEKTNRTGSLSPLPLPAGPFASPVCFHFTNNAQPIRAISSPLFSSVVFFIGMAGLSDEIAQLFRCIL